MAENQHTTTLESRISDCGEIAGNNINSIYLSSNPLTIRRKKKGTLSFSGSKTQKEGNR